MLVLRGGGGLVLMFWSYTLMFPHDFRLPLLCSYNVVTELGTEVTDIQEFQKPHS